MSTLITRALPGLLSAALTLGAVSGAAAAAPSENDAPGHEVALPGVMDGEVLDEGEALDEALDEGEGENAAPEEDEDGPIDGDDTAGADAAELENGELEAELEDEAEAEAEDEAPPARRPRKPPSKSGKSSKSSLPSKSASKSSKSSKSPAKRAKSPAAPRPKGAKECDYRTPIYEHVVVKGEHLGAIAGRYGVRRQDLLPLNPALEKNPNLLRPGQVLRVCPELAPRTRQELEHVVVAGENPTVIARKYGLHPNELLRLQRGAVGERLARDPRALRVGDRLRVVVDVEELPELAPEEESDGVLAASVQLPTSSRHYLVKRPYLAYGTPRTIKAIQAAISRYKQRYPRGPRVHVGDISKKGGGPLPPHRSHQRGVDVDIGLVHRGILAGEKRFVSANPQTLDVARTWALVKAFADTREVRAIFLDYGVQKILYDHARRNGVSEEALDELFQYPRGRGRGHGLIRHWRGHKNHIHVRFRG